MEQLKADRKRFDPYKNYRFRILWEGRYVAGLNKVGALKRTTEVIEHRQGGDPSTVRKSPGQTKHEAITLERGVTHDPEFDAWANKVWNFGAAPGPEVSLADFRKDIVIDVFNEAGERALSYKVLRCWVSEYQALPDLDANENAFAIQTIKLENEGWERDTSVYEPEHGLNEAAREMLPDPTIERYLQIIEPPREWDRESLPETTIDKMREIEAHMRNRQAIYEKWGFGRKLTRGRGISALFTGAAGTGKTMAAEFLAFKLERDLYLIDLGMVMSKYIGETEKNLRKVFDRAEETGAVLFFDGADALFGKRSEVKDSHDRFANIEINYLLQKMEEYSGLCILATNKAGAIDPAFMRRIRFVIKIPGPPQDVKRKVRKRTKLE